MDDPLVRSYGSAFAGIVMISVVIEVVHRLPGRWTVDSDRARLLAQASHTNSIFFKISLTRPVGLPILMIIEMMGQHDRGKESCTRRPVGA
jgi:hypothetical protein